MEVDCRCLGYFCWSPALTLRPCCRQGRRQADGCAGGITLANLLSMLLVLLALGLLPGDGGVLWPLLQLIGGAYFAWIGLQALLSQRDLNLPVGEQSMTGSWWYGLRQGLLASSFNPKLPLFYAGLFGVLREAAVPNWGLALAMLWMTMVVWVWDLALVRLLDHRRWRAWLQQQIQLCPCSPNCSQRLSNSPLMAAQSPAKHRA